MIISIRLEYNELTIMNIYHVIHVQVELSVIERNHNFNNNNIKKKLDSRFRGNGRGKARDCFVVEKETESPRKDNLGSSLMNRANGPRKCGTGVCPYS